jgi:hypothetical protein
VTRLIPSLLLLFGVGHASIAVGDVIGDDATRVLPIAPRKQAAEAPPSGWCGETAIQEALLHAGVWSPQRLINRAGNPSHPDLYSSEIPVALDNLGVKYRFYVPRQRGFAGFAAWVKEAIDAGEPVFAGVKILPTQHPDWGVDHFVLVVGYGPNGLLVNTTWGYREWVGDTTTKGLSFKNVTYGIRLRGISVAPNAVAARLSVVDEAESAVGLRVVCEGLTTGAAYRIERWRSRSDKHPLLSVTAIAINGRVEHQFTSEPTAASRFDCVRQ